MGRSRPDLLFLSSCMLNRVSGSVVYRGCSAHKVSADCSRCIHSSAQGQEDRSSLTIQECQMENWLVLLSQNDRIPTACGPSLKTSLRLQFIPDIKCIICRGCSSVKLVFNYDFAETSKIKSHKLIFWHRVALSARRCQAARHTLRIWLQIDAAMQQK